MVCPYCSTDITPIELNGKVFCSNCGLTISNHGPVEAPVNTITPGPITVSDVVTESAEEVAFPVIPEVVEAAAEVTNEQPIIDNPEEDVLPVTPETAAVDYFGQFGETQVDSETAPIGRKLEVVTEEATASDIPNPITDEAVRDMGITPSEPIFESKISDLTIPTEEDFSQGLPAEAPAVSSYVELANPGNEKDTLEASSILLDILGEDKGVESRIGNTEVVQETSPAESSLVANPGISSGPSDLSVEALAKPEGDPRIRKDDEVNALNPVEEPEIPEKTETDEKDDIYVLPTELKVGIVAKKKKMPRRHSESSEESRAADPGSLVPLGMTENNEKEIEEIEEKLAEAKEPVVELTPEAAANVDPDTLPKAAVIKDYFTASIEKDKQANKAKDKKKKKHQNKRILSIAALILVVVIILGGGVFYATTYYKQPSRVPVAEKTVVSENSPTYVPEGYVLVSSNLTDDQTLVMVYHFAGDETKTITFKRVETTEGDIYIADYIAENAAYTTKDVNGVTMTEVDSNNLLWKDESFVYVIETKNFTFSNELLYNMAEQVE